MNEKDTCRWFTKISSRLDCELDRECAREDERARARLPRVWQKLETMTGFRPCARSLTKA